MNLGILPHLLYPVRLTRLIGRGRRGSGGRHYPIQKMGWIRVKTSILVLVSMMMISMLVTAFAWSSGISISSLKTSIENKGKIYNMKKRALRLGGQRTTGIGGSELTTTMTTTFRKGCTEKTSNPYSWMVFTSFSRRRRRHTTGWTWFSSCSSRLFASSSSSETTTSPRDPLDTTDVSWPPNTPRRKPKASSPAPAADAETSTVLIQSVVVSDAATGAPTASNTIATLRQKKRVVSSRQQQRGWDYRLHQLRTFSCQNGHCRVTASAESSFPGLYQWTRTVRSRYKQFQPQTNVPASTTTTSPLVHDNDMDGGRGTTVNNINTRVQSNETVATSTSLEPKEQSQQVAASLSREQLQALIDLNFCWDLSMASWDLHYQELELFYAQHDHCRVPLLLLQDDDETTKKNATANATTINLGVWVRNQRRKYASIKINSNGGDHEPLSTANGGSAFAITEDARRRVALLDRLGFFDDYQSHESQWMMNYQQLHAFYKQYDHCHVPQQDQIRPLQQQFSDVGDDDKLDEARNWRPGLGAWCMNQRTAYKRGVLSETRIQSLEALNFCWNINNNYWHCMLLRLRDYFRGHQQIIHKQEQQQQAQENLNNQNEESALSRIFIPVSDTENRDLRLWLAWQRYCYHNNNRTTTSRNNAQIDGAVHSLMTKKPFIADSLQSPPTLPRLSEARIQAIETVLPGFCWSPRDSKTNSGPSSEDWAKLFDAMRDKGIQPGVRPKQHWFEGMNVQAVQVKDTWTEQELLALWNQGQNSEDDEDDYDNYVDLRDQRDRGYN